MTDEVSNRESQTHVAAWVTELRKVTGQIPIVVVGNKVDLPQRVVKARHGTACDGQSSCHGVNFPESEAQEGSMMMRKLKVWNAVKCWQKMLWNHL